jgi:hypothetical protein
MVMRTFIVAGICAITAIVLGYLFLYFTSKQDSALAGKPIMLSSAANLVPVEASQRIIIAASSPWTLNLASQQRAPMERAFPPHNDQQSLGKGGADRQQEKLSLPPPSDLLTVCSEPSPDALTSISRDTSVSATVKEKLFDAISSNNRQGTNIGLRTPSIQALRDAMFRLCEAFTAGGVSPPSYTILLQRYQNILIGLIGIEELVSGHSGGVSRSVKDTKITGKNSANEQNATEKIKNTDKLDEADLIDNKLSTEGSANSADVEKAFAEAIVNIVTTVVKKDQRSDFCMSLLSWPEPAMGVRPGPNGIPVTVFSPIDDALRSGCVNYLFALSPAETQPEGQVGSESQGGEGPVAPPPVLPNRSPDDEGQPVEPNRQ